MRIILSLLMLLFLSVGSYAILPESQFEKLRDEAKYKLKIKLDKVEVLPPNSGQVASQCTAHGTIDKIIEKKADATTLTEGNKVIFPINCCDTTLCGFGIYFNINQLLNTKSVTGYFNQSTGTDLSIADTGRFLEFDCGSMPCSFYKKIKE